jgi:hypothetical protein
MNGKKVFGWILKIPLILLNIATLGVGIYAAMGYVPGFLISWAAPAIIGGMQLAYIIGAILINKSRKDNQVSMEQEQYSSEEYNEEQYPAAE